MREITFKGKRVDNGEWIEGAYMPYYYSTRYGKVAAIFTNDDVLCKTYRYPVDPSTVGQYTGLKDKNGKKIFEGDLVIYRDRIFDEVVGVIEYDDGCFCVHTLRSPNSPAIDIVMNESEVEVIGNIHDDKEILNDSTV